MKRRQTPPVVPSNPVLTLASRTASWRHRWSNSGDRRRQERPRRASLPCSRPSARRDSALPLRSRLHWPIPYKKPGARPGCRRRDRKREVSPLELVDAAIERIEEVQLMNIASAPWKWRRLFCRRPEQKWRRLFCRRPEQRSQVHHDAGQAVGDRADHSHRAITKMRVKLVLKRSVLPLTARRLLAPRPASANSASTRTQGRPHEDARPNASLSAP
jgi:hypothetical protein